MDWGLPSYLKLKTAYIEQIIRSSPNFFCRRKTQLNEQQQNKRVNLIIAIVFRPRWCVFCMCNSNSIQGRLTNSCTPIEILSPRDRAPYYTKRSRKDKYVYVWMGCDDDDDDIARGFLDLANLFPHTFHLFEGVLTAKDHWADCAFWRTHMFLINTCDDRASLACTIYI